MIIINLITMIVRFLNICFFYLSVYSKVLYLLLLSLKITNQIKIECKVEIEMRCSKYYHCLIDYQTDCSVAKSHLILCDPMTAACQTFLSFSVSLSLLKLMSIELVMPSHHLIFCCPLLLLLSVFPSVRIFTNELALCIRWPKY